MKKFDLLGTWLAVYASALRQRGGVIMALITTLILFDDTLLPLPGHLLHVLFEVINSTLEHFLESVFHVSKRQSQIILFYSELAIAIYLSWCLSRKAYFTALHAYSTAQARWRAIASSAKAATWFRGMIMVGALSVTLYLFT
ncbi:MAG: hypothetical protein WAW41_20915 [Methylobacter sp.]